MKPAQTLVVLTWLLILSIPAQAGEPPTYETSWGSAGVGDGQFLRPLFIAIGTNGNFYVSGSANDRIQIFGPIGDYVDQFGETGAGNGQFDSPTGVAVDGDGDVYVVDHYNHRVQKFDRDGNYLDQWGGIGTGPGLFDRPTAISVNANGEFYVTDTSNHRVQKFDHDFTFLLEWGQQGALEGQFNEPRGIAVDSFGNVYVADGTNDWVQKFDENGTFLDAWGNTGSGDGEFENPYGIWIDRYGYVYVADFLNDRVQKFDSTGTFDAKWGSSGTGAGQFRYPSGVIVDAHGNVYVVENLNHRVQKFRHAPLIDTVRDVPGDEGLSVYLSWYKSPLDVDEGDAVTHYTLWRAIAPVSAASFHADHSFEGVDPDLRIQQIADRVFFWELIDSVDAYALEGYGKPVPTLFDAPNPGDEPHYFQVIAHTRNEMYTSAPESGYSVDNLAPNAPSGLQIAYVWGNSAEETGAHLTWLESEAEDFRYFKIYRGNTSAFEIAAANLEHTTTETSWLDPDATIETDLSPSHYYRMTAVDFAGNESEIAIPVSITGVAPPTAHRFELGVANPNPFNPHTSISYSLGKAGRAELVVYDLAGRRVKTLVSGHVDAGRHEAHWDGTDVQGRRVASGVYLYRLVAGDFSETKRMVLLK